MDVKIIGRSSGRSATGAAAYRAGEKLHSVAHASYQAGEKLQGTVNKNDKITHDYTRKKGIVHSEIILPKNAPSKYTDRQTLWNAVELSETRKNSQLAREIIIALPIEFNLQEHLEVIRKYAKDNFVDKGMIADFAIHDTENDNPHAHIMLTTRNVTQEGFSEKNREWNKKENLLEWRKAWAHVVNEVFERKGLAQRIDHRTLKAQGIDRKPMIHLGYKASALEKKGIHTDRGNYNREINHRNNERDVKTQEQSKCDPQKNDDPDATINATSDNTLSALEKGRGEAEHATLMSAKRNMREKENPIKAKKTVQTVGKLQKKREAHPDKEQNEQMLEKITKPPKFIRERLQQKRIERRSTPPPKKTFKKPSPKQAYSIIKERDPLIKD
ncbi:MAG: MobA/MobL family protein [Candidatus Bathyarchaeota archaeon]|nr:MobA/MobL family protein [Candidatus Termiticorpusculum sp.]